jgi:sec-independent protein translocase protein TatB
MFDIGWSELLVIAAVALVVIGPKELPGVLRSIGHWMGKIRRMASEFQSQFQEAMREAEMADLKKHADDLNAAANSLTSDFDPYGIARDVDAAASSPPTSTGAAATTAAATPEAAPPDVPPPAQPVTAEPAPVADSVSIAPDATPPAKGAA